MVSKNTADFVNINLCLPRKSSCHGRFPSAQRHVSDPGQGYWFFIYSPTGERPPGGPVVPSLSLFQICK